jgi:hypothetical protein
MESTVLKKEVFGRIVSIKRPWATPLGPKNNIKHARTAWIFIGQTYKKGG